MSMSDILAALLLLLVPLRHSKADRRMAKDAFALIQDNNNNNNKTYTAPISILLYHQRLKIKILKKKITRTA